MLKWCPQMLWVLLNAEGQPEMSLLTFVDFPSILGSAWPVREMSFVL